MFLPAALWQSVQCRGITSAPETKLGALLGQKLWFQFPTASTQVQSEHSAILAHCKQFDVCLDIVWTIESLNNVIRMGASFHWGPFGWTGRRHRRMWTWSASVRSANVGGPGDLPKPSICLRIPSHPFHMEPDVWEMVPLKNNAPV